MEEKNIRFAQTDFSLKREHNLIELSLLLSETDITSQEELSITEMKHHYLMHCQTTIQEEKIVYQFSDVSGSMLNELDTLSRVDKLRLALNVAQLEELLQYPLTFFISPDNLVFDRNLNPKILYRGWKEKMVPDELDNEQFLRQYKAFLLVLFSKEELSYYTIYDGELELLQDNHFNETVQKSTSFEELVEYVEDLFIQESKKQSETKRMVPKKTFMIFKYASIWLSVAIICCIGFLSYTFLYRLPFQDQLLDADEAYFQSDYGNVLNQLDGIDIGNIPMSQKYITASSVVRGADLTSEQRQAVQNTLSLNSDENYLDYWIQIGRGNFEEAVDLARLLDELDLILYALALRMEQVRGESSLSGIEQEELLSELQNEYDSYYSLREERLEESGEEADLEDNDETNNSEEIEIEQDEENNEDVENEEDE